MDPARVIRGKHERPCFRLREERVKKLIISLLLVGACRSSTYSPRRRPRRPRLRRPVPRVPRTRTGAVRGFMAAAKQTDLQALGTLWGDKEGPARGRYARDELEKRGIIMTRCLRHDSYDIVGDAPAVGGARAMVINLKLGDLARSARISGGSRAVPAVVRPGHRQHDGAPAGHLSAQIAGKERSYGAFGEHQDAADSC